MKLIICLVIVFIILIIKENEFYDTNWNEDE